MKLYELIGFVLQFGSQRRQFGRGQWLALPPKRSEENCVYSNDFPRNVADPEIETVQLAHPQLFGGLAEFAKNLWHKSGQSISI